MTEAELLLSLHELGAGLTLAWRRIARVKEVHACSKECKTCSVLECPSADELHYRKVGGCPSCTTPAVMTRGGKRVV